MDLRSLKNEEKAIFELRSLYEKYGYSQYKMSKFEEYDLYVRNKNFLVSDNIITFTDTNGKLMALKPDVTLSIIKNSKDTENSVQKVYYNENVYRVSKGTQSFKEIMQVGLECIGDIDNYNIYEVLMLAAESLKKISASFVLDVSNLEIVSEVIEKMGASSRAKKELIKCMGEKNIHGINAICKEEGVDGENLKKLVSTYGNPDSVLPVIREIVGDCKALQDMEIIVKALKKNGYGENVHIDFSVIDDMSYYNGFVFKGFVDGISASILSGGQYDNLMVKMRRKSGAIGFAVYLDALERLGENDRNYDVDIVVLYDSECDIDALNDTVNMLTSSGNSVMVQKSVPEKVRYRQLLKVQERGVQIIENNA